LGQDWALVIKEETFTLATLLNDASLATATFAGGTLYTVRLVRSLTHSHSHSLTHILTHTLYVSVLVRMSTVRMYMCVCACVHACV
jgi:hypothetical protein